MKGEPENPARFLPRNLVDRDLLFGSHRVKLRVPGSRCHQRFHRETTRLQQCTHRVSSFDEKPIARFALGKGAANGFGNSGAFIHGIATSTTFPYSGIRPSSGSFPDLPPSWRDSCYDTGVMDRRNIRGLLIDLDGVLYVGGEAIPGAREALEALDDAGIARRFVTNTTTRTAAEVVEKLERLGFAVAAEEVFSPVTATRQLLENESKKTGKLPGLHLVVRDSVKPEFADFPSENDRPDYVVVGDIGAAWSYPLLNRAFRHLMNGAELLAMHRNKFFQGADGLELDIGAFVAGLEFVTGHEARIIGKPSPDFFQLGVASLGLSPDEIAMIGDDIDSDVGGGQASGLAGILVRTGKYREAYVAESVVTPDAVLSSFADLPEWLGRD